MQTHTTDVGGLEVLTVLSFATSHVLEVWSQFPPQPSPKMIEPSAMLRVPPGQISPIKPSAFTLLMRAIRGLITTRLFTVLPVTRRSQSQEIFEESVSPET